MPTSSTARVRAPRSDAAANREALIQAAATVLNADPTASLESIATAAGLSRRAFYGHFATRDALLAELARHGAERITRAMLAGPEGTADDSPAVGTLPPDAHLALVGARLWDEVDHVRTMALITVRGPQAHLVGDGLRPLRRHVHAIVKRGAESGLFRADIPSNRLARLVESAAISVLDESTRFRVSSTEGRRLVVLSVLSMAGLGHVEAARVYADFSAGRSGVPASALEPRPEGSRA